METFRSAFLGSAASLYSDKLSMYFANIATNAEKPVVEKKLPTRISADKTDPGYAAWMEAVKDKTYFSVTIDGVEQGHVETVDTERGFARVFEHVNGKFTTKVIWGKVAIQAKHRPF